MKYIIELLELKKQKCEDAIMAAYHCDHQAEFGYKKIKKMLKIAEEIKHLF